MAQLTTNTTKSVFGGTKIDLNGNFLSITFGNSISVTAGIANAAYFGAKTQLVAGVTTNITLGTSLSCTYGSILGTTYGNCWSWSGSNNTVFDIATRWGATQNIFAGGVSPGSFDLRKTEETQGKLITLAVVGSYIVTIGLTIFVGLSYPPFTMVGTDDDGNATGVEVNNTNACITFLGDGIGIIILGIGQWWAAQIFAKYKNFDPVSYMDFTAAGANFETYAFPDNVPTVEDALIPQPGLATLNAKAAFYMRPYIGVDTRIIPPPQPFIAPGILTPSINRAPVAYAQSGMVKEPETELLTVSGPGPAPFSQIYITPMLISIGTGLTNTPDVEVDVPYVSKTKKSMASTRALGTGPYISFDNAPAVQSVTLAQDVLGISNTIKIDLLQTTIKRLTVPGSINLLLGGTGIENKFVLDGAAGATLSAQGGSSSIAITPAGQTTIYSSMFLVGTFSAAQIELISGPASLQISSAGAQYTGPLIQI